MGVANECIPFYEPGSRITGHAEAAITGRRFVDISDPQQGPAAMGLSTATDGSNIVISHCAAGAKGIGVASHDCAIGSKVAILGSGFVVPVRAGAAITAGQEVEVGAGGTVIPLAAGKAVGKAFDDIANGADGPIKVY